MLRKNVISASLVNTIEEASRSKFDSEWPANVSYNRNVFIANCSTSKQFKDSAEQLIYIRLTKSFLELLSIGTVSCSVDTSFAKLLQLGPQSSELSKEMGRTGVGRQTSILKSSSVLSMSLLSAYHAVLSLVPKGLKFELIECISHLARQDRSLAMVNMLLPTIRQCVRFMACCRFMRFSERMVGTYSVDSCNNDRVCSVYRSFVSKVIPRDCRI